MSRSSAGESALSRGVRILGTFDSSTRDLGISEMARRAAMPVSSAQRVVASLCDLDLLERVESNRFRIGVRLWELAAKSPGAVGLRELALPSLQALQASVGQHTQFGILQGTDVLYLERLSSPTAVVNITKVGGRLPFHLTSSGLVLAAFSVGATRERLDEIGGSTVKADELRRIKMAGYAVTRGYIDHRAASVAAPVLDPLDMPIAAVSYIVPTEHSHGAQLNRLVSKLTKGAREIAEAVRRGQLNVPPIGDGTSSHS